MDFLHWLRLLVAAILASELFIRLPLGQTIRTASLAAGKSQRLLRSKRISDHWKERMLPRYAMTIGTNSVVFFALLCLAITPVVLVGLTDPAGIKAWLAGLMSAGDLIGLFVLSLGYIALRVRLLRG